jgi:hypothetical protein
MKETTSTAKSTASVRLSGQTVPPTSENFIIITFTARVFTRGPTTGNTRVNGEQTKCMVKALLLGQITASTSENMQRTRRRDTENSSGQMEDATEASGSMENNTERVLTSLAKAKKSMGSGKKANALDGLGEENKSDEVNQLRY